MNYKIVNKEKNTIVKKFINGDSALDDFLQRIKKDGNKFKIIIEK